MKKLLIVTAVFAAIFLIRNSVLAWDITCSDQVYMNQNPNNKPCINQVTGSTEVRNWVTIQSGLDARQVVISWTININRWKVSRYSTTGRDLTYSNENSQLVMAWRTIRLTRFALTREYYTKFSHVTETISACKTGYEYFKNLRLIKVTSVDTFSARVIVKGSTPYKTTCQILKVPGSY